MSDHSERDAKAGPSDSRREELEQSWHDKSTPAQQFDDLVQEEMGRIWDADPRSKGRTDKDLNVTATITGGYLYNQAVQEVKAQWNEQGIWKKEWEQKGRPCLDDPWKHEESLE